jgi:predicted lipoprotein with Yx(FWY)xxD motif
MTPSRSGVAARKRNALTAAALTAVVLAAALTGCGAGSGSGDRLLAQSTPATVSVRVGTVPGLGRVLTDAQGHALYMFPPDAGSRVSCTGPCAGTWPPLAMTGTHPTAGQGVDRTLLATRPDPNTGGHLVTYANYALYRYAGDTTAGTANGQGLFLNGGPWYVLTPAGNPVTSDPGVSR